MSSKKIVFLTGGLGNQLFQFSCALSANGKSNLFFDGVAGSPRLNSLGKPELHSLLFPAEMEFSSRAGAPKLYVALASLAFKVSSKKFDSLRAQTAWLLLKNLALHLRVFFSDGVGFDPRILSKHKAKWIFGPFHTYRYSQVESTYQFLREMSPRHYPRWLEELRTYALIESPIVLHIRLSDYKNIRELGILKSSYFNQALRRARMEFPNSKVWLFTDEEDLAMQILGDNKPSDLRIINHDLADSTSNLEAMRFGQCYILSNSTFSWWGAFLSHSENPMVFCPEFWFATKDNPRDLIPPDWIRINNR